MRIAIFGGKGSGEDAAQNIVRIAAGGGSITLEGYLNDELAPGTALLGGRVLGRFEDWPTLDDSVMFIAPLQKAGEMQARTARIEGLGVPRERWATILDPSAAIAQTAMVDRGAVVGSFAVVGPGTTLGMHAVVRPQGQVSHDVTIGEYAFVGAGSVICGYSTLHFGAYVAPGAVVRDRVTIGRFAVVGLGAVVVSDVPDFAVVTGNPARIQESGK